MSTAVEDRRISDNRLLTKRDIAQLLGITPRSVNRLMAQGRIPAPQRYGHRTARWPYKVIAEALGLE